MEVRSTGSDYLCSGGFSTASKGASGVDYSQQNAAQAVFSGTLSASGTTTLSDSANGFLNTHQGNLIRLVTIASSSGTATGGSSTTLVNSGAPWTSNQFAPVSGGTPAFYRLGITGGTGSGQQAVIASNTTTTITIATTFATPPDATSTYSIDKFETFAITGYTSASQVTVDRALGTWSGVYGYLGGALASPGAACGVKYDGNIIQLKATATYSVVTATQNVPAGAIKLDNAASLRGYATTRGDGGKATIDGGSSGAAYVPLTVSAANAQLVDLVLTHNGATGASSALVISGANCMVDRVVVHDVRSEGFTVSAASATLRECEAYATNQGSSPTGAGVVVGSSGSGTLLLRVTSHDNVNAAAGFGFQIGANCTLQDCISDSNAGAGVFLNPASALSLRVLNCDIYNNGSHGLHVQTGSGAVTLALENSNFLKNAGYGVSHVSGSSLSGWMTNCGFGAGTQANTSGQTNNLSALTIAGTVAYANDVTPWIDPVNGNFSSAGLAASRGAGRGGYTQTQASYGGTIGYPDIGAAPGQPSTIGGILASMAGMSGDYATVKQSTTSYPIRFRLVDAGGNVLSGITPTIDLKKPGTSSWTSAAGSVTASDSSGECEWSGNATDRNTVGRMSVRVTATGARTTIYNVVVAAYDPVGDAQRGTAGTALPAIDAGSAGAIITAGTGTGQLNVSGGRGDANATQVAGTSQTARDLGAQLDAAVSSRLATTGYTAPDNTSITAIKAKTDSLTFTVANVLDANTLRVGGTVQTARDLGASVLISAGTGAGQLDVTAGRIKADAVYFGGVAGTFAAGRPEVNATHFAGTAFASAYPARFATLAIDASGYVTTNNPARVVNVEQL